MKEEILKVSLSSVAQALAMDYFCIYYVNTDNNKFIQYSASEEYQRLGLASSGDDFVAFSRDSFEQLVYPEDRDAFLELFTKENLLQSLQQHHTFTMTFRLMFGDIPTYVHLKATRMNDRTGKHIVIGISSVDEQMRAREAYEKAHHSSLTFSRIAQALAEGYFTIYYVDMATDYFIEYSSDDAYKALNMETSGEDFFNLSRKNICRVMYEKDLESFLSVFTKENIQHVLDEHKVFTLTYRLVLDGEPTYVSMKITRMKDNDGNHIIIGVNNIDAQMKQQAELEKAEKERLTYSRVAQALAGDYFCIYVVDPVTDRFVEYSATSNYEKLGIEKGGEDFFNLSRRNIQRVIDPEDQDRFLSVFTKDNVLSELEKSGIFTIKYRLLFSGEPTYVSMKATLLDDRDGKHVIIGINNIDIQMKREKQYQESLTNARNRAKNDFLANMSHDIRTPMNAIVGYTNIANAHLDDPQTVRDSLEKIGSSSHFLLSLINDILDMSKIESGKLQLNYAPCDLEEVLRRIEDITALQARNKSLQISYKRSGLRHMLINADELRIEQILINIISNAIKYTPEGKSVELLAEEEELPGQKKNRYRFVIRDTGIGISEEYLPHIFESFTREQKTTINRIQGTGLGLAITARVVEMMGGTISVKSKPGEGSEFTVVLELEALEEMDRAEEEQAGFERDLSGKKILLVEDNDINAEIAGMVLRESGLAVDRAFNGQDGFEKLRDAGEGAYGAVLMDIQMPVLNGYDATRAIRGLAGSYYQQVPIIAMSANAYNEDVKEALDSGMNAHIAKPFDPVDLLRLLREMVL